VKALTVRLEGGILGPDVLEALPELPGQAPKDFGLDARRTVLDHASGLWSDVRSYWDAYQRRLRHADQASLTTVTREQWVLPLLEALGYRLTFQRAGAVVGGEVYPLSHRAGDGEEAPPVHIVGSDQELGRRPPAGRGRRSPHALLQEYLNRTEHLWGIVTNGHTLRVLRQAPYVARQAYIEFDLQAMVEGDQFHEFILFLRLAHRTRLPKRAGEDCLVERYHQQAIEQGGRIRDKLRDAVERGLLTLASGFLRHPKNDALRAKARAGDLSPRDLYRQLLHLVYRLFFLLVGEERGLLSDDPVYRTHYSLNRLQALAEAPPSAPQRFGDLYLSLRTLFHVLRSKEHAETLGLPPLNGELFSEQTMPDLEAAHISNKDLLETIGCLSHFEARDEKVRRRVNYAALDVEELGSVYESLLDLEPRLTDQGGVLRFEFGASTERKSTGSYYTPRELVHELVESALVPVLQDRLQSCATAEEKERAILALQVCDPACGSGHFLLAAARRLGRELARARTGEDEPAPEAVRAAVRDAIAHCIHGVDKNPLAVELCKVALWIEGHTRGKPLTFLDHRIRCGDSLVGVMDLSVLDEGIPDEAYTAVTGDDKAVASAVRTANRRERKDRAAGLMPFDFGRDLATLASKAAELSAIRDDHPADVGRKAQLYASLHGAGTDWWRDWMAANLWTAAFFTELTPENRSRVPTSGIVWNYLARGQGAVPPQVLGHALALAQRRRFFHWPLEFPEVFQRAGFDVVLGNPPWERIKLQEQEFFATRDPEIAKASNKAARARLIRDLPQRKPDVWAEYLREIHDAEALSAFLRKSGRFPLTARGDINTYSVFAELGRTLSSARGRAGMVLPTGIATDDTNKVFFGDLVEKNALASLFDFENREKLFPSVDSRYKFSLLTMRGKADPVPIEFAFFATRVEHLRDGRRRFSLTPDDFRALNPNTRTCPVFRTRQDAELTKAIYRRVPVLVNEAEDKNPWGITFRTMFHMSNDSGHFRTRDDLQQDGFRLVGNRFIRPSPSGPNVWLPLYEAKMIWHFDHRSGTYAGVTSRQSTQLPELGPEDHADPARLALPWYWVPASEVEARLADWNRKWLLGFRRIARSNDERTTVFSLIPRLGAGDVLPVCLFAHGLSAYMPSLLVANMNSIACDHVARQKIGGTHLDFHYAKQLAVLTPTLYSQADQALIVPRSLELVYTAWDVKPFADDVWCDPGEDLRQAIRAQWEENAEATGGHTWHPPDWIEAYPEIETNPNKGIPLPPFKWDEDRRARIRAELDAYYAKLYGLTRKQLRYILDPADLTPKELQDILDPWEEIADPLDDDAYRARVEASDFPGETFRVLKEKEIRAFGHYRSRRLVLQAWEEIEKEG
jgi:hypothetical protein